MQQILDSVDLSQLTNLVLAYLPRVFAAILVFVVFLILFRVTRRVLRGVMERAGFADALIQLMVDSIYRYTIMIIGLVMAADQLGINVAAALAGLGIAGIAVGFAAQDSVANVISGIIIFWDKPFKVGDWIKASDQYGEVREITLRSTRIRTPRNTYVVIPNKSIIDTVLENYSKHGELRVDVPVGIAYKEKVRQAREVLLQALKSVKNIRNDPGPDVVVEELGGSSVNLKVRVWIDEASQQQSTFFEIVEMCKVSLDEAGIEIPFPHLQLFVDDVRDRVWDKAVKFAGGNAA